MATDRATLHLNQLDAFAAFCETLGWTREAVKGDYEVFRMTRPLSKPMVLYGRNSGDHATFGNDQYDNFQLVKQFLRAKRKAS